MRGGALGAHISPTFQLCTTPTLHTHSGSTPKSKLMPSQNQEVMSTAKRRWNERPTTTHLHVYCKTSNQSTSPMKASTGTENIFSAPKKLPFGQACILGGSPYNLQLDLSPCGCVANQKES